MRILIVGAGIAGLSVARALKKYGVEPTIIEKESSLSQIGAGIALPANATKALDYLGLKRDVLKYAHKVNEIIYAKSSGEILNKANLKEGDLGYSEFVALLRRDLINTLYSDEFKIKFGCSIEFLEDKGQEVFTKFDNNEECLWDLVIAADGINSSVRSLVFTDNNGPKKFNIKTWRFLTDINTKGLEPKYFFDKDTAFMIYPISSSRAYCYAHQCRADKNIASNIKDVFKSYSSEVNDIITKFDQKDIINGYLKSVSDIKFYKGRVVLVGDASSACSPMLQQGAASAFEDAIILAHKLNSNSTIDIALKEYEKARKERVSWIVKKSDAPIEKIQNGTSPILLFLIRLLIKVKGPINVQFWKKLFKEDPISSLK